MDLMTMAIVLAAVSTCVACVGHFITDALHFAWLHEEETGGVKQ